MSLLILFCMNAWMRLNYTFFAYIFNFQLQVLNKTKLQEFMRNHRQMYLQDLVRTLNSHAPSDISAPTL